MEVNKELAFHIFEKYFLGISLTEIPGECFLSFKSLSQKNFDELVQHSLQYGDKLDESSFNDFIAEIKTMRSQNIRYSQTRLEDKDILCGEILQIYLDTLSSHVTLMKINEQEYLVIDETENLPRLPFVRLKERYELATGELFTFGVGYAPHKVIDYSFLAPTQAFRYFIDWLQPKYKNNDVCDNVWYIYNDLRDAISQNSFEEGYEDLLEKFARNGISFYSMSYMIKSINWENENRRDS